uniref:Uncharacterized protein n=1 Tax=viral metagenome TaxID=1070528 RepID=A0A6C0CKU6_9ZZZZ
MNDFMKVIMVVFGLLGLVGVALLIARPIMKSQAEKTGKPLNMDQHKLFKTLGIAFTVAGFGVPLLVYVYRYFTKTETYETYQY